MLYPDSKLRRILTRPATVAVVGAKDRPGTPVDMVGRYLIEAGFTVIPVHPVRKTVWGLPALARLADAPGTVDIVNLFRAAENCPEHAREVLALPSPPRAFWMQSGVRSPEARALLASSDVFTVEDRCIMVEHRRLWA